MAATPLAGDGGPAQPAGGGRNGRRGTGRQGVRSARPRNVRKRDQRHDPAPVDATPAPGRRPWDAADRVPMAASPDDGRDAYAKKANARVSTLARVWTPGGHVGSSNAVCGTREG